MEFEFLIDGTLHRISAEKRENVLVVREGDKSFEVDIHPISENVVSILFDGRSYLIYAARDKDKKYIFLDGQQFVVQEYATGTATFEKGEEKTPEGKLQIKAPMPGKVIKINVREGEEVRKNQTLAIVEAMKMENEIKSSIEGFVKKIHAAAGELVDSERPLIELEPKFKKGGCP